MTAEAPSPQPRFISTLLVANRGEIAVRVIRACRELGIRSVAVFSEADSGALWTRLADSAVAIGPAPVAQSYLDANRIIAAAREAGADAIHPGYGMLSENAGFASAVADAGLIFVGPDARTIALMGDKVEARRVAVASGLPVNPGSEKAIANAEEGRLIAEQIGYPVVVKASFGGGGRGLRVAHAPADLEDAFALATGEARKAFANDTVFVEKYLEKPRHIEVQILADQHGNAIHLGDRDCTVQRRHQKLLEEAPAPSLPESVRTAMQEAALRLCRDTNYVNAGTVEFLFDPLNKQFFFLEMNTRVQVEHGVTELVTGFDIVREQISVAAGGKLSVAQEDVEISGHAIQARITAEDPWAGFNPATGRFGKLTLPGGLGVRCDFGITGGEEMSVYYDSLVGKVHAFAPDRSTACTKLAAALRELIVEGVPTTAPYLAKLLDAPDFRRVMHDTNSVERDWQPTAESRPLVPGISDRPSEKAARTRTVRLPWGERAVGFAISSSNARTKGASGSSIFAGNERNDGRLRAPMPSLVSAIHCEVGQHVDADTILLTLEAMKMELAIKAPFAGVVSEVRVSSGETVEAGALLGVLDPLPK